MGQAPVVSFLIVKEVITTRLIFTILSHSGVTSGGGGSIKANMGKLELQAQPVIQKKQAITLSLEGSIELVLPTNSHKKVVRFSGAI